MMRELLRPRALVGHLLVTAVVVTCVTLGQWQLDRLQDIRERNERSQERLAEPPVDLDALAASREDLDLRDLEYRRVAASGVFRPGEEVLQRNRSFQNQTGFHVLTPLELNGGGVVLVRRGWVPADLSEPPVAEAAPPPGRVEVLGVLERPVEQPSFGPTDPPDGRLERVFHTDTARLDAQVEGELFPMVVRPDADVLPTAGRDDLPIPPGPPILDERNHLSYAVQWHVFALLASVTYLAWWWTRSRRGEPDPRPGHRPLAGTRR